jgi:hypothetical protein
MLYFSSWPGLSRSIHAFLPEGGVGAGIAGVLRQQLGILGATCSVKKFCGKPCGAARRQSGNHARFAALVNFLMMRSRLSLEI